MLPLVGFAGAASQPAIAADEYPTKPVKVVVAFAPGSTSDVAARRVGQPMAVQLGQPVVVENRPGASGGVAAAMVSTAKPDGYVLLWCNQATHGANPALHRNLNYDALKDFTPIVRVATSPLVVTVNSALPSRSLPDFVALAKAKPGTLRYASAGNGSLTHILGELLARRAGVSLVHVPYKGDALGMNDAVGGHVEMFLSSPFLVLPQVKANRLHALAVSGPRRLPALLSVPTLTEAGIAGADLMSWGGLCAPARTPQAVIDKLNQVASSAFLAPDLKTDFESQGYEVISNSPQEFAAFIKDEIARLTRLVNELGIRADE
jgi:tripartite-type tricarboxylate transporter receptor subunit TctC